MIVIHSNTKPLSHSTLPRYFKLTELADTDKDNSVSAWLSEMTAIG